MCLKGGGAFSLEIVEIYIIFYKPNVHTIAPCVGWENIGIPLYITLYLVVKPKHRFTFSDEANTISVIKHGKNPGGDQTRKKG